jgi:hypothetical protein
MTAHPRQQSSPKTNLVPKKVNTGPFPGTEKSAPPLIHGNVIISSLWIKLKEETPFPTTGGASENRQFSRI